MAIWVCRDLRSSRTVALAIRRKFRLETLQRNFRVQVFEIFLIVGLAKASFDDTLRENFPDLNWKFIEFLKTNIIKYSG